MKGVWITPDFEAHEIYDVEHIDAADKKGWLDKWKDDKRPGKGSKNYYDWVMRMLNRLYDEGYTKARYYTPNKIDPGEIVFQGNPHLIPPEVIQLVLEHYKLPATQKITIEDGKNDTLFSRGTMDGWEKLYAKKQFKPLTNLQRFHYSILNGN